MDKEQLEIDDIPVILFDAIEEEATYNHTEFCIPNSYGNSDQYKNYAELDKMMIETVNEDVNEYNIAMTQNLAHREDIQASLDVLTKERLKQVDAMKNSVDACKDYKHLQSLHGRLHKDLAELKQKYKVGILQKMLDNYVKMYKFKIAEFDIAADRISIVVQFIVDGQLISALPVRMDIAVDTSKIVDIDTRIYPRDRLLKWLSTHDDSILDVIIKLKKTLQTMLATKNKH